MKVLLVHNFYRIPGGEDSVVREELSMLKRNGVSTELFSAHNDHIGGTWGAILTAIRMTYNFTARADLAKKLKECSPDVVHIHNFFPLLSPSVLDACREAGVPVVMTLHNFRILTADALLGSSAGRREPGLRHATWWAVPRRIYRNSALATFALAVMIEFHKRAGTWTEKVDLFIAPTSAVKQKFVQGGLPPERIVVKPHCTTRPTKANRVHREGGLFVGRLDQQKGIDTLLRAWQGIEYPLKIIGDGPLAELVARHRDRRIAFLGRQPRDVVQREMQSAKFLVMPSVGQEVFGMVALEAFANGLPVICSGDSALGELVESGVTGLKFCSGDAAALAKVLRWAVANPSTMEELGRRAFGVYEERYTPEVNFKQLVRIYNSVQRNLPRSSEAA